MKKKTLSLLALLVCAALSMVACASGAQDPVGGQQSPGGQPPSESGAAPDSAPDGAGIRVGVLVSTLDIQFFSDVAKGVEAGLRDGDEAIMYSAEQNVEKMAQQMEDLITKQVDYITVTCIDQDGLRPAMLQAQQAGVPVITFDKVTGDTDLVATQLQSDDYALGARLAEELAEMVGYAGQIMAVDTPSLSIHGRIVGIQETLAQYPDIELVLGYAENTLADVTLPVVENMLTQNMDVVGWLGCNETQTTGAIAAFETAGVMDGVRVCTVGEGDRIWEFLRSGQIRLAIDQQAWVMGTMIADAGYRVLAGEEVDALIPVPYKVVTLDNLDEYLEEIAAR